MTCKHPPHSSTTQGITYWVEMREGGLDSVEAVSVSLGGGPYFT